jgi:nucleolar protein 56
MIIQAIALLDQLDKDVNLFSMRIREWYGYHFPELIRLVPDNHQYAQVAKYIGDKETLDEEKLPDLAAILNDDSTVAQNILDAARGSMGSALSEIDMININAFATRVVSLSDYRKSLVSYLSEKMNSVAPSLTALLGERVSARLISHAGSLTNLSKYPASTVQILGAEKALFRALKTKGNTPKVCGSLAWLLCFLLIHFSVVVWSSLPLHLHRPCWTQAQRSHFTIPRQQVLNSVSY